MRRYLSCLAALLLAAVAASAEARGSEIRDELEAVCRSVRESFDPFYGRLRAREIERRLEAAGGAEDLVKLQAALGRELLKLDRAEEAVALLAKALAGAGGVDLDPAFVLDLKVYLGLAHLLLAEDQNCVAHHHAASCILPFSEEAIHRLAEHTRKAGDVFLDIANEHPGALQTLWLLNLARMVSGDYPGGVPERFRLPAAAFEPQAAHPRWRDRAPDLGIATVDLAGGAVMDDFDGDGLLDLVSSTWDPCGSLRAFRNLGGTFEDVTVAWGLDEQLGGLNLVHADANNDGRLDLLVLRGAWMGELGRIRNSLLLNESVSTEDGGTGVRFRDVTREAGLAEPAYPTQTAAWADFDGDGDLDLYVGNEDPDGRSFPSQLFRNDSVTRSGVPRFTDVAAAAGVANHRFAKSVAWGDFDDDGRPDLYVSNSGPNRLYRNHGPRNHGSGAGGLPTFTDVAAELGVTEPEGRSFVSWFFDVDNDGDLDLFVNDFSAPVPAVAAFYFGVPIHQGGPRLYRNDRDADGRVRFTDAGSAMGLARPLLPMGSNYGDLDNDGFPDVYLGTGEPGYETIMPNVMFRNAGGTRFDDVTFAGGFGHLQKGHGVAFGDVDNDGDQDLFHQLGGFFPGDAFANALYENPSTGTSWITLRLEGKKANSFGVGARIEVRIVEDGKRRSVHALAGSGGSFGGSSMQQEIGLGTAERIEKLVIRWPGSGTVQAFDEVALSRVYRAVEGASELVAVELVRFRLGRWPK
ncbi:MAG: CRTAC1 family protein [Thermoanaerobaculia bacterium]